MFVLCSSDEIGLFVPNSDFVFVFARFHRVEGRSSLFSARPTVAVSSGTQKQGGEVKKTGNGRSKVPLFLTHRVGEDTSYR